MMNDKNQLNLTDYQLAAWAVKFGDWKYFHSNDQLQDPNGGLTTAKDWENIGAGRREQILSQMKEHATESQIDEVLSL